MKKILSIMLCAVMLLGAMMSVVTAAVPDSAWELAEYGQDTIYTGAPIDDATAPIVDGVINEGEYKVALEPFVLSNKADDGRFYVEGASDIGNVEFFTCRDSEYWYFAIRFENETLVSNKEKVNSEAIAMKISPETTEFKPNELCDIHMQYEADGTINGGHKLFDSYTIACDDNVVTFEGCIEILAICDAWGLDDVDKIYFLFVIMSTDANGNAGDFWYAFKNAELLEKHPSRWGNNATYPHVVQFSADPDEVVETEPTETEPTETEPEEAEPTETEPTATEPTETEPTATEPTETEPTATEPTDTTDDKADDKADGCGASVSVLGIALVATLGTAVTVVAKKKD